MFVSITTYDAQESILRAVETLVTVLEDYYLHKVFKNNRYRIYYIIRSCILIYASGF